jgi:hypothetical protein
MLKSHKKHLLLILSTAGLYFIRIFSKIIFFRPDGLYASHQNVWSDWALHITLTNTFANKPFSEWFLYHPYFSGGKLTYPFLNNAISGVLMKLGLNLTQAMIWPSILLILLLLIGIYFLFFQILKSKNKATLGIFIFLSGAGPGFINFLKDFFANPSVELLTYPPIDYTRTLQYQWLAGNIPTAMLVPQRAFLLGITLGVWVLFLLITAIQQKDFASKKNNKDGWRTKKLLIGAGLLAGILPIAHMHSFIAVVIISGSICLNIFYKFLKNKHSGKLPARAFKKIIKNILYFVVPVTILSTALFFTFVYGGIQKEDFMRISLGWTSQKDLISWIVMWWKLWGVMLPLAIYSLRSLILKNKSLTFQPSQFFYGFFALFIISNIIVFQPTAWDNTKLFAWVYLGFSLLAAHMIIDLWQNLKNKTNKTNGSKILQKVASVTLIIMLSTTGVLELIRLQGFDKNTYKLSDTENIKLAKQVMKTTPTNAVFLTASDHNHPLLMWGSRQVVLGYKGWVTNFGFDIDEKSRDVKNIFEQPAKYIYLLEKYNIDYVVIGEAEKREFVVDQEFFNKNFNEYSKNNNTFIYIYE